ncbi:MAG: serine hydrolase domain-containing protein [Flavisolibacter sp.]
MKQAGILFLAMCILSCSKSPHIRATDKTPSNIPWMDSSSRHPKAAQFQRLLQKYNQAGLPGISLLVRDKAGTWCGSIGKADLENNVNFTVGQISKIASVSKFIIGTMIFRMMEDSIRSGLGYNALNKPISTWLPSTLTNRIANGNISTLGQLMNHETGIPDLIEESDFYLQALNNPNKIWSSEELVSFIFNKSALFQPGDTAIYSNTNIILITMIAEKASGQKHGKLVRDYIFDPLGMKQTYYFPHEKLPGNVSQGYYDLYNNNSIVNVSNIVTGGMFSTIFDLYKFLDAVVIAKYFLTPKSWQIMTTWGSKADPPNIYGYGIMKKFIERPEQERGWGHSGRDLGYTANLFYFPYKDVAHIFLINYGSDGGSKLREVFYQFQDELIDLGFQ